jgi:phosphoribosylaminoimidazolecarboxamide formyltransferase/IMP cyclohydrolase
MLPVRRALLSTSDKRGLVELAKGLAELGIELWSTGGTARALEHAGLPVRPVDELTGFPEMMDGRVKTLHPAVHGGILARRDHPEDLRALDALGHRPIDLVVVNLYPFEATVARPGVSLDEAIEQIDIGGPSMLRSAAKNHAFVGVVSDPDDYPAVLGGLRTSGSALPEELRRRLAAKAFLHTATYDAAIAGWMARAFEAGPEAPALPPVWGGPLTRVEALRYGENPHQAAALYRPAGLPAGLPGGLPGGLPAGLIGGSLLQGKPLSYNNWLDMDAGFALARDLGPRGLAILKHTNPSGAAVSDLGLTDAYAKARACDPVSAFGGVVATAGVIDGALAEACAEHFLEVVVCAGLAPDASGVLARKKNLRVWVVLPESWARPARELVPRAISGGLLVQEADLSAEAPRAGRVVTERAPTDPEWAAMAFGWTLVRHVKSNAIVFAAPDRALAVGAGQMSRVDAARIAVQKATTSLAGSACASDAFFPFPDGLEAAARAGATAVIQPGGSVKDAEVIAAANRLGLAMVFTGTRHFRH